MKDANQKFIMSLLILSQLGCSSKARLDDRGGIGMGPGVFSLLFEWRCFFIKKFLLWKSTLLYFPLALLPRIPAEVQVPSRILDSGFYPFSLFVGRIPHLYSTLRVSETFQIRLSESHHFELLGKAQVSSKNQVGAIIHRDRII